MEKFAQVMIEELVKVYIEAYGMDAWTSKTEEEKAETLHELLGSFLTVCKRNK